MACLQMVTCQMIQDGLHLLVSDYLLILISLSIQVVVSWNTLMPWDGRTPWATCKRRRRACSSRIRGVEVRGAFPTEVAFQMHAQGLLASCHLRKTSDLVMMLGAHLRQWYRMFQIHLLCLGQTPRSQPPSHHLRRTGGPAPCPSSTPAAKATMQLPGRVVAVVSLPVLLRLQVFHVGTRQHHILQPAGVVQYLRHLQYLLPRRCRQVRVLLRLQALQVLLRLAQPANHQLRYELKVMFPLSDTRLQVCPIRACAHRAWMSVVYPHHLAQKGAW